MLIDDERIERALSQSVRNAILATDARLEQERLGSGPEPVPEYGVYDSRALPRSLSSRIDCPFDRWHGSMLRGRS